MMKIRGNPSFEVSGPGANTLTDEELQPAISGMHEWQILIAGIHQATVRRRDIAAPDAAGFEPSSLASHTPRPPPIQHGANVFHPAPSPGPTRKPRGHTPTPIRSPKIRANLRARPAPENEAGDWPASRSAIGHVAVTETDTPANLIDELVTKRFTMRPVPEIYMALVTALEARRRELGVSLEALCDVVGCADRYLNKAVKPHTLSGRVARIETISDWVQALYPAGFVLEMAPLPADEKRHASLSMLTREVDSRRRIPLLAAELFRHWGASGGRRRTDRLTPEQRQKLARKAARSRWRRRVPATTGER